MAVRRAVARTLTGEGAQERTLRQLLHSPGAGRRDFDRAYGLVRMKRAGVDLDQHPEWKSLQVFYEMGVRPPTHQEEADSITLRFGTED